MDFLDNLLDYLTPGEFLYVDLLAASTNALNGALLSLRPDHYKGIYITTVGVLVLALFGGIGGGVTRDLLLNDVPDALTNPWYLILCFAAFLVGLWIAYDMGQKFRETTFQFWTSFSLPWYAVVGVEKGLEASWPLLGAIFLWDEPSNALTSPPMADSVRTRCSGGVASSETRRGAAHGLPTLPVNGDDKKEAPYFVGLQDLLLPRWPASVQRTQRHGFQRPTIPQRRRVACRALACVTSSAFVT